MEQLYTLRTSLSMIPLFPNIYCTVVFLLSLTFFFSLYFATTFYLSHCSRSLPSDGPGGMSEKRRSWIITGASSFLMTVGSLPFVWDLCRAGGDVAGVGRREWLSQGIGSMFTAYLMADCVLGSLCYRSQFTTLTGWFHHSAYTILLHFILKGGYIHCFSLCAFMELPTLVLSLGVLIPSLRNDELFSGLFFSTRICFHLFLVTLYGSKYGRTYGPALSDATGVPIPSFVPILGLCLAAPLHIFWFISSFQGLLKRRRAKALILSEPATNAPTTDLDSIATAKSTSPGQEELEGLRSGTPLILPPRPRLVSMASSYLTAPRKLSLPPKFLASFPARPRFSSRRPNARSNKPIDFELLVRDYFNLTEWRERIPVLVPNGWELDADGLLVGLGTGLRVRAGKSSEDLKQFGGRLRRRVGGIVAAL